MARVLGQIIGTQVCKALGIDPKDTYRLIIDLQANNVATVTISQYLTDAKGNRLAEILEKKYKLELLDE